ncbi:MAG: metal ABC transporter solute-binding protein, Zn/Mn family, partial [Actinomycetota bacterium]
MHSVVRRCAVAVALLSFASLGVACSSDDTTTDADTPADAAGANDAAVATTTTPAVDLPDIVVTYSVLGAFVERLVGDSARVTVLIPDGQDPHDFEPSP